MVDGLWIMILHPKENRMKSLSGVRVDGSGGTRGVVPSSRFHGLGSQFGRFRGRGW